VAREQPHAKAANTILARTKQRLLAFQGWGGRACFVYKFLAVPASVLAEDAAVARERISS
jgi:hypothetical protein